MTKTIEQLTARVRELEEENARLKAAVEYAETIRVENIAYATTDEEDDLTMLFFDAVEARKYSGDDEPIKLIVKPDETK